MHQVYFSKKYLKSLGRLEKNLKVNAKTLNFVIKELANKRGLEQRYKDHQLKGNMQMYRECHVHNDILLLYQYLDDKLILVAVDIGTHSQLF